MTPAEHLRHEVLAHLAERHTLAQSADVIRRSLNRAGIACSDDNVLAACDFLEKARLLTFMPDKLGSTKYWTPTAEGILHHERSL